MPSGGEAGDLCLIALSEKRRIAHGKGFADYGHGSGEARAPRAESSSRRAPIAAWTVTGSSAPSAPPARTSSTLTTLGSAQRLAAGVVIGGLLVELVYVVWDVRLRVPDDGLGLVLGTPIIALTVAVAPVLARASAGSWIARRRAGP